MTLESKAKTLSVWYIEAHDKTEGVGEEFENKLVSLVDAQKEIAELKLVADSAHKNAQWTMDANRRQVEHIKALEAKIEAANKKLLEKLKAWRDAYSLEANDLQAEAIRDLEEVWDAVHIPRKENQGVE